MKRLFTSSSTLWLCLVALMMMASQSAWAEYVKLTALDGTGGTGGEGYASLVDGKTSTKMGHSFDPTNPERANAYIVVKAAKAVVPDFYFLVTGGDTGSYPTRNWKKWNIYGGNFESDADAKRDVENFTGWTLIDERDGDPLPQANTASANFQFNNADGVTAYQYFWIEILESVQGSDIWLQMAEWGLGTYGDFEKYLDDLANATTGTDEPVVYTIIDGDRRDGSGEALEKLFDGDISTKWGMGLTAKNFGETTNGAFFIIKTSRAMAPTYYKLVTGTDNASWNHRNWNSWQIYAMAQADVPSNGKPTRASDKWVMIDKKDNISEEILPDKNMFTVLFGLSEENTTTYQYFKVEIDRTMAGSGYMQMGEFSLGDEYTIILDRTALAEEAEADFSTDIFAEKTLVDAMADAIASVKTCTDPFVLGELSAFIDEQSGKISTSANQYAELTTARNKAINLLAEDNLTDAATTYATGWVSETEAIAPGNEYPVGNYGYIKANRQITGTEAVAEAKRFNEYLTANVKVVDDPIYAEYTALSGSGGFGGEDHSMLIDGDRDNTKWCSNNMPGWMIFKTDSSIKPSYYGLVTGGDTDTYKDRNWKSWKIYAANFDSDEEATMESDKWVLIDEKNNVGTDVLKTTNKYESYINLSIGCSESYKYFMIKDVYAWGGLMQMNEFTFYNQGNLNEYREGFIEEFQTPEEIESSYVAYQGYIDAYKAAYNVLKSATNPPDVMKAYNDLKEAQENLQSSAELYEEYRYAYEDVVGLSFESESMSAWQEGYTSENQAPNNKYIRGTYDYIMETLWLDNEGIRAETAYLRNIYAAVEDGLYILLGGHTEGQWGDGFYGHLINVNKNGEMEGGNDAGEVKWGGQADFNGNTYIIFRTLDKTNPFFYTLTTGNDTQAYYGRNWGTWYIYGANFEGDGDATKDAEGWVLIDAKENIGQDRLHPVNNQPSYFGFSTETTEEYTYYKVVVTKAYEGSAIQMNELHFGTEEEFDEIKDEYIGQANEFDYDVVAEQALIDAYEEAVGSIEDCTNMEALFRVNYYLEDLRERITASAATYEYYKDQVEAAKAYLEDNALADSEAKTVFVNYLNDDDEPSELYPNGAAGYILEEHVLADSVVTAEIDFMESLKVAAVAVGYGKGMEISSLIVNRTFKKAGETVKDDDDNSLGREAEGWNGYIYRTAKADNEDFYAAEFCNENKVFDINQTLTNLKNGYYKVTLNAGFRASGDMKSYNYAAMAYANDVATFVPAICEGMVTDSIDSWQGATADKKIYNEDSTEVIGWGIWGCEGAAYAFENDRYAITLVAQVTDGKLTIGVKNEGTTGNEWTAVGNFNLFYLGEDVADAAEALQEVAAYNAARITSLVELYETDAYDDANYAAAPGFGAAQKTTLSENSGVATFEAEKTISETMQSIVETKKAYITLFDASVKVYEKWFNYAFNDDAEAAIYDLRDSLQLGAYADAAAAMEAKARLYAKFPGYLQVKNDKGTNVQLNIDGGFTFEITTTGANPSLELTALYEALAADEVILSFDYTAQQDIEGGYFYYETPNLLTDVKEEIPTLPETADWTTVYYSVVKGIEAYKFGSSADHGIFWGITNKANKENTYVLGARNFRFITKAQMEAEGGSLINPGTDVVKGDLNGDSRVDIADAVTVLDIMAEEGYSKAADLNGDGKVDIADFVSILDIMAEQ
ncbi:MAG: hypothetical protein IKP36_11985 [Bacteroidaceae bacterium]|nr:hypothetical protein [Bacteroidaceae bacterium]